MEGADLAQREEIRNDERLKDFLLEGVEQTGATIGNEGHGRVVEVEYAGAPCVAKEVLACSTSAAVPKFLEECRLLAKLRHPKIVQFIGICFLPSPGSTPLLVMERLRTNLGDVLEVAPAARIPLTMKCSILRDVASGLAFLHNQTPPIVHRDVTAKNVLLNDGMEAKLANFEMSRFLNLTDGPSTQSLLYMPPEASTNTSIDIFSYGILTLFTLTQVLPQDVLPASYTDQGTQTLVTRSEVERRQKYIEKLHQVPGISKEHTLVGMVMRCLENDPQKRLGIHEILQMLEPPNDTDPVRQDILQLLQNNDHLQQQVNTLKIQQVWQARTYYYNHTTEEVWSLHTTGDGRMFYHNIVTGEMSWTLPGTDVASSPGPSKEEAGKYEPIPVLFHDQHIRAVKDARKLKRRQSRREKRPSDTEVENVLADSPREMEMPQSPQIKHSFPVYTDKENPLASSPKVTETEIPQSPHVECNPLDHAQKKWQECTYFYNCNTKEAWTRHATGDGRIFYCNIVTNQISWVLPGTNAASTSGPTKEDAGAVEPIPALIHLKNLKGEKLKRRQSKRVKNSKSISLPNADAEKSTMNSPKERDKSQSPCPTSLEEKKENTADLPRESDKPQSLPILANHEEKESLLREMDKQQLQHNQNKPDNQEKVQPQPLVPPTPPPRKLKKDDNLESPNVTGKPQSQHVLANHEEKEKSFADTPRETDNPQSDDAPAGHDHKEVSFPRDADKTQPRHTSETNEDKVQPLPLVPPTPPPRKLKKDDNLESPNVRDKPHSQHVLAGSEKENSFADTPRETDNPQSDDAPAGHDDKEVSFPNSSRDADKTQPQHASETNEEKLQVQPQSPVPPIPPPRKFKEMNSPKSPLDTGKPQSQQTVANHDEKEISVPDSPREMDNSLTEHIPVNHEEKVISSPKEANTPQSNHTPENHEEKVHPQSPVPPTPPPRKLKSESPKPPIPYARKESLPENVRGTMEGSERPEE